MNKLRLVWLKIIVVLAIFGYMYGYNTNDAKANFGCNTTQACTGWTSCHCGDSDCGGCYIPNGQGGCGTCAGGKGGGDMIE